jgi:hypothetical protein
MAPWEILASGCLLNFHCAVQMACVDTTPKTTIASSSPSSLLIFVEQCLIHHQISTTKKKQEKNMVFGNPHFRLEEGTKWNQANDAHKELFLEQWFKEMLEEGCSHCNCLTAPGTRIPLVATLQSGIFEKMRMQCGTVSQSGTFGLSSSHFLTSVALFSSQPGNHSDFSFFSPECLLNSLEFEGTSQAGTLVVLSVCTPAPALQPVTRPIMPVFRTFCITTVARHLTSFPFPLSAVR